MFSHVKIDYDNQNYNFFLKEKNWMDFHMKTQI
jgi:hypothetical protein